MPYKHHYPATLVIWIVSLSILLGGLLSPLIYSNIVKMVHSFNTAEAPPINPEPLYGFYRPGTTKPDSKDFTFGIDFGDIFYNAKHFYNGDLYTSTKYDVYERPLLYPPFLCFLYNHTLCHLAYPKAVLIHLSLQIILLLSASFFILNYYRLSFMIVPVTITYFIILFLTPVGLAWVERGQSDIYSGLAILFFMFAVYESKAYAFVLSAFFVSLKPTIAPLFVQAFAIYLLVDFNYRKLLFFSLFTAVVLLTFLPFPQYSISYMTLVYNTRMTLVEGITLVRRMPDIVVFLIPIVSIFVYLIPAYLNPRKHIFLKTFLPYSTGLVAVNILLTYSSWEYRIISFLGFIPMVIAWFNLYGWDKYYRREFASLFLLFLFVALHGFWIISAVNPKWEYFIASYIAYYLAVTVISVTRIYSNDPH